MAARQNPITRWVSLRSTHPTGFTLRATVDGSTDLPDGLFGDLAVQPSLQKYFGSRLTQITSISTAVPPHTEGRIAIVTSAGRDAVDAKMLLTNSVCADGEVVWS